eukprot:jgi/Botrbrau1/3916/Bobra.0183s0137.1
MLQATMPSAVQRNALAVRAVHCDRTLISKPYFPKDQVGGVGIWNYWLRAEAGPSRICAVCEGRRRDYVGVNSGPKTIHFWAPTFKWGISLANIADFKRPAESISTPQQVAVAATGLIWSRFATQIEPVNYNLLTVNIFMAATGLYQLSRKVQYELAQPKSGPTGG